MLGSLCDHCGVYECLRVVLVVLEGSQDLQSLGASLPHDHETEEVVPCPCGVSKPRMAAGKWHYRSDPGRASSRKRPLHGGPVGLHCLHGAVAVLTDLVTVAEEIIISWELPRLLFLIGCEC